MAGTDVVGQAAPELSSVEESAASPVDIPPFESTRDGLSRLIGIGMWTAARVAAGLQFVCGSRSSDAFSILIYHRVANRVRGVPAPTCNVSPIQLRRQLVGLLERGFTAWTLSELVSAHRSGRKIPSNVFAVTFDDGYENNYLHAWPILRELKIPATIFLATRYLDTDRPFPFDDWSATGSDRVPTSAWRPLSTAQCEEMLASGLIELGAHTHTHGRFLGRCEEFRRDLSNCLDELRQRFGIVNPTFAFPFGDSSPALIEVTKQLKVSCSLTTRHRQIRPGDDAYEWGRFDVSNADTAAMLAAKLSGWYSLVATGAKQMARPFPPLMRLIDRSVDDAVTKKSYRRARSARNAYSQP